jgi:bidirectional [NiFe] hydrogenase diaphorase subunit
MSEHLLTIDGKEIRVAAGTTVLEAARGAGIEVPTLCYHEELAPFGGCRLCVMEVQGEGGPTLIVSCVHPVEREMVLKTRSEKVDRIRKTLLELLLAHAPQSPTLLALAQEYGADPARFEQDPSFCVHCGLCVRYCAEVVGKNAVGFIDRGIRKEISFIPEIAAEACGGCQACFPLCPTSYLQAAYVLARSLAGF